MTATLAVRMDKQDHDEFMRYCREDLQRRSSDVVRELIAATVEGRIKITPTKGIKELYND